jgi:hypothetical protein
MQVAIDRIRQAFPGIPTQSEAVAVAVAFTYQAVIEGVVSSTCQSRTRCYPPTRTTMTTEDWLEAAGRIVGTHLCVRSSSAGCLLTPADWSGQRKEPFWTFVRQRLAVSPSAMEAALALIHLHGQWTARRPQSRSTRGSAAAWLGETLTQHGPLAFADVRQKALQAGLAWDSVRRASHRIEVRKHKTDFRGPWIWTLQSQASDPHGMAVVDRL